MMRIALGIDTGGTYTDAVLVDHDSGHVLRAAKALTTRYALSVGISEAIDRVFAVEADAEFLPADVVLVGLSTTLATNAMVEGQGGPACLLLIGYDPDLMNRYGFHRELGTDDFVYIQGGHNHVGDEVAPLDEEALTAAVLSRRDSVEAFAISGYFSVRNPAHEERARALVEELTGLPVTCGHELSSRLNAVRRATTAALNARLIVPLRELIATVGRTLAGRGIAAPLMVVKGDGSLVRADWAMRRPIETILSGPAASVVGAWHLAGRGDAWVVDVGGTTTDIAGLRGGWPRLNAEGARVGGWRTMVQAIDVHTTGLGGDSHVRAGDDGQLVIGPRRVVPLSLLAGMHPHVASELRYQAAQAADGGVRDPGEFVLSWRPAGNHLIDADRDILARLEDGPRPVAALVDEPRRGGLLRSRLEDLTVRGLIQRAAFTPTDALHVLHRFNVWDTESARLGAGMLAARLGLAVDDLCSEVVEAMARRVATELVSKALEDQSGQAVQWEHEPAASALLARSLRAPSNGRGDEDLSCALTLHRPIVAIGAPVAAYLPRTAEYLHTELVIPPHAEVANAVGAVAGGVIQRVPALISPLPPDGERLRLFLPAGTQDFDRLDEAIAYADQELRAYAVDLAHQAGADHVELSVERQDHYAHAGGATLATHEIYLGTDLTYVAVGRPAAIQR